MLEVIEALDMVATCLARSLVNEGARHSSERQAIRPARYGEGTLATDHNAATGDRGYTMTLAHPEGSYIQIHKENLGTNQTRPENLENGSKKRRFTAHSHTSYL